jgi:hypothetical protein
VVHLLEPLHWLAADALGRRIAAQQLWVLALQPLQLVDERVIGVVADLWVVEIVIAVRVAFDLDAKLSDTLGDAGVAPSDALIAGIAAPIAGIAAPIAGIAAAIAGIAARCGLALLGDSAARL